MMSASVKTAISLQKNLLDEVNQLANELNVSRSRLFVLAIEEYLQKNQNHKMLAQINATLDAEAEQEDAAYYKAMKHKQRQILAKEAW